MNEASNLCFSVDSISRCNPLIAHITFGKKSPTFSNSEANYLNSNGFGHRRFCCKFTIRASITSCSWWITDPIHWLNLFLIPDSSDAFLLSHYESFLQSSKFYEQIHVIQMVSATGWSPVNWQWRDPSLQPCILEMYLWILQTVLTMFKSNTFKNY